MRVHIRAENEYHSQAYAVRVNGASTEFLIVDPEHKPRWIDISKIKVLE